MPSFLWETHVHTSESSLCADDTAADMVRAYHRAGYHGLIITDHFVTGNSTGNISAPWHTRVDILLSGYRAALAAGEHLGMAVLLGWEFPHDGGDYLTYGLGEAFLYDNPGLNTIDIDGYVALVHREGGFVCQAHPYRQGDWIPSDVAQRWDIVDAFEVVNGSHHGDNRRWDQMALETARAHGLLETAGSDAHRIDEAGTAALAFAEPFDTMAAFLAAVRAREGHVTDRCKA